MAFPVVATPIETFTASNGNLDAVIAAWTQAPGAGDLVINSNQVTGTAATPTCLDYKNNATYGPNCEFSIDIPTIGASGDIMGLSTRLDEATFNGYLFVYAHGATGAVRIRRLDAGAGTTLGADGTVTLGSGDGFGCRSIGSTHEIWTRTSGVWTLQISRTDATYNVAGRVSVLVDNNTYRLDNLAGGTIRSYMPPPPRLPFAILAR